MPSASGGPAEIDRCDQDRVAQSLPQDWLARLRAEAPVYWQPEPPGPGFWWITRHEAVGRVAKDPERFLSGGLRLWYESGAAGRGTAIDWRNEECPDARLKCSASCHGRVAARKGEVRGWRHE